MEHSPLHKYRLQGEVLTRLASSQPASGADTRADKTIQFVFSNPGPVRGDNHQLKRGAWVANWKGQPKTGLTNFKRNPVVLEGHDPTGRSVGRVVSIEELPDGRLVGTIRFADTEDGNELFQLYRDAVQNACSIGYAVADASRSTDPARGYNAFDIDRAELLEISLVPVPADENALVLGRALNRADRERAFEEARNERAERAERARVFAQDLDTRAELAELAKRAEREDKEWSEWLDRQRALEEARKAAFFSFGQQMQAVWKSRASGKIDSRLVRAPAGAGEIDPSGGGFLVAEDFIPELVESLYQESVLLPLVDMRETLGPVADVKIPAISEESRADGSRQGGALAYWVAEAATIPATFPRFRQLAFSSKKLAAVVYTSNEAFNDSAILESSLRAAFAQEMAFAVEKAIFSGIGAGQPLGILNSNAKIQVSKESGQAAKTIVYENVLNMWSRLAAPCRHRAVWLINQDIERQLFSLSQTVGTTSVPVYMPADSNGVNLFPTLFGRPVIPVEYASTLGTEGDIVLADFSQYIIVHNGMRAALSADVSFANDQTLFRFTWRLDGQPAWATPITPYQGTETKGIIVTLASR